MAKFETLHNREGYYYFYCPGCKCSHYVNTEDESRGAVWDFNGDVNYPTVSPSVLVGANKPMDSTELRCHSFIRDGHIIFLDDCEHSLAGKTVPLPEI